jgi:O-antigen ligase
LITQEIFDWGRDLARLPKPVFVLLASITLGYVIAMRYSADKVEKLAMIGAIVSCLLYILFGVHGRTDTAALIDFEPLWNRGGFYLWIPVMLLIVVRFMTAQRLGWVHLTCAAFLAIVVFESQSRAVIVALVIGAVIALLRLRGQISFPRTVFIGVLVGVLAALTIAARYEDTPGVAEVNEMEFTAADYGEESQRWRGFEAFQAGLMWTKGSTFEKVFGHGMGAGIDLGGSYYLAGRYWETLPQSHNGYATLLVKTGIVGIACYLFFYLAMIVVAWRTAAITERPRKPAVIAALGAAAIAPILAYTVEGYVSPGVFDPMLTFVGAVLGANTWRIRGWVPWTRSVTTDDLGQQVVVPVRPRRRKFVWLPRSPQI